MKSIWQEEYKIKSYEVDSKNRLQITQLFNFMQEAAGNHAYDLGCGYDDLIKDNYIWVLSKVKVNMTSYPSWGESFTVETWPKGAFRLYASRDFIFKDSSGSTIGVATSIWLLLDVKTMRPQRVENLKFNYHENESRHGLDEMLEKLSFTGEFDSSCERIASYTDIDVNNHVNNAKYVDWIMDCFPVSFLADKEVKTLQINYISEAKPDEVVLIRKGINMDGTFFLEGINKLTQAAVFQAKLGLSDNARI